MAAPVKPQKKKALARRRVWWVDAIANPAIPKATEINAGDYLACFPLGDVAGPVSTPEKVTLPALLCEEDGEEDFGTVSHSHPDITFLFDPQAAAGSPGKKAWDIFKDGAEGFLVWELGKRADVDDQIVAGEFVTTVPAKVRVISEEPTATGSDGLLAFQTTVVVRAPYVQRNVAVVV